LAAEVAIGVGTGLVANFISEAFKSWIEPNSGKRITAKLGDMELSTSEISVEEFKTLLKALQSAKEEADIRAKILESGVKVTVVKLSRKTHITDKQS
jgi:hypothetical protein